MALLIHIATTMANEQAVRAELERCCAETGDVLIGHRVYEEVEEVLFVVRLMQNYFLTQHTQILNHALQHNIILSFQPEMTNLVLVEGEPDTDIRQTLRAFPLKPNESWFPAVNNGQQAYVCTRKPLVTTTQALWFDTEKIDYTYV